MIAVNLFGGMGNQLFQYAAGRCLSIKLGVPLKLDITGFTNSSLRPYSLYHFHIAENFCTESEIRWLKKRSQLERVLNRLRIPHQRTWYLEPHFHFDTSFFKTGDNTYLEGYLQSEKYFIDKEDIIRQD